MQRRGKFELSTAQVPSWKYCIPLLGLLTAGICAHAGTLINARSAHEFQVALNTAMPGDTIVLDAGVTYIGSFRLRNHGGSEPVTIRTSALALLPPSGVRVTPLYAQFMPRIVSPGPEPALTVHSAHHYRIIGVEIAPTPGVYSWTLVDVGAQNATALSQVASHIDFDRVYIHGDPSVGAKRGITLNGAYVSVRDSWISGIAGLSQEAQALAGWNGPGPFTISNNYLEAAGENVMFGGALATIPNVVPCDITITGNHFFKPLRWKADDPSYVGQKWIVKNLFELKNACRVTVEGNLFENNWSMAQNGFAILFTVRTEDQRMPWAVVEDVVFKDNILRNSPGGINILGTDGAYGRASRITVINNLFERVNWRVFQLLHGASSVTIDHNTAIANPYNLIIGDGVPTTNLVVTNNLFEHGQYGIVGSGTSTGTSSLNKYFPGAQVARNAFIGGRAALYPSNNFFPTLPEVGFVDPPSNWALMPSSTYKCAGLDGKDIGADIPALQIMEAKVKSTQVELPARVVASLMLKPVSVTGGTPMAATITLSSAAPVGGLALVLRSSNSAAASVASFVTVPAGARTLTTTIQTSPVTTDTPVSISAGVTSKAEDAIIVTQVTAPRLIRVFHPGAITSGSGSTGRVDISGRAPEGGLQVMLASSHPLLAVPSSVTVQAGSTSAYIPIRTAAVASDTAVTLNASLQPGGEARAAAITLKAPVLSSLTGSASLVAGRSGTYRVSLNGVAAVPVVVALSSSAPGAASVPGSITIPVGASSAVFNVISQPSPAITPITIASAYGGAVKTIAITVTLQP